ncbi:2Fe-2S iron-sulfur cluster-binding protein [Leisingera sp. ANG59]|uniref:2Fe-2S iron-sulfur cluster-binding protein n=1 Tax=Leisingera sp. ANG59 TaxID=2675221 RepID=UPI0015746AED|nr:2Fe-2S iron-sulfur cluster-binding protein [Leisingera sp. ANG59]NSY39361.1 2Fe-2S iron-sulfur cluster binding domain-containing protein [Leisingera sp. ANG59]
MITIKFIQPDGSEKLVSAMNGRSLMEAAQGAGVVGIVAECGGSAACATCHVVLPQEVFDRLGAPEEHEEDMLDFADAPRQTCSRLSCQVRVTPDMDGIIVRVPTA